MESFQSEPSDWRDLMPREARVEICCHIMNKLASFNQASPKDEIKRRTRSFEAKTFGSSNSRDEYLNTIASCLSKIQEYVNFETQALLQDQQENSIHQATGSTLATLSLSQSSSGPEETQADIQNVPHGLMQPPPPVQFGQSHGVIQKNINIPAGNIQHQHQHQHQNQPQPYRANDDLTPGSASGTQFDHRNENSFSED